MKHVSYQPPLPIVDAMLYKMKADYLRYISECITGDDGLLTNIVESESFDDDLLDKEKNEIRKEAQIDCWLCNDIYNDSD